LQCRAFGEALAEFGGLAAQRAIGKPGDRGLERVDLLHHPRVLLQQPLVAATEDLLGNAEQENQELAKTFHEIGGAGRY
jgi:hypothetical protein